MKKPCTLLTFLYEIKHSRSGQKIINPLVFRYRGPNVNEKPKELKFEKPEDRESLNDLMKYVLEPGVESTTPSLIQLENR